MSVQNINDRVLVFPEKGKLLVSSDLHGNKSDYLRMLSKWADSQDAGNETYLLFLGDLVHGPAHPDQMTRLQYNHDDSEFIVDHLMAMQKLHPGKFFSLLGNHEHGHVGGPDTSKFHTSEVDALERKVGSVKAAKYRDLFNKFPLVGLTSTGLIFTHGAGSTTTDSLSEIVNADYNVGGNNVDSMYGQKVLDMLWRRGASDQEALDFMSVLGEDNSVLVYGHDIVIEGFDREGDNSLCLSTSFGLKNENKTYMEIDLSKKFGTSHDIKEGTELKKLWENVNIVDPMHYEFAKKAIENGLEGTALYALMKAPGSAVKDYLLGRIMTDSSDLREINRAVIHLKRAVTEEPGMVDAHMFLAKAYLKQGDSLNGAKQICAYSRALSHCREVSTLSPENGIIAGYMERELSGKLSRLM